MFPAQGFGFMHQVQKRHGFQAGLQGGLARLGEAGGERGVGGGWRGWGRLREVGEAGGSCSCGGT